MSQALRVADATGLSDRRRRSRADLPAAQSSQMLLGSATRRLVYSPFVAGRRTGLSGLADCPSYGSTLLAAPVAINGDLGNDS
jgi:hypothetical protein